MKKLMVSAFMLVAVGAMFMSCENGISNGCKCTLTYNGYSKTYEYTQDQVKAANVKSCAAFASWAEQNDGTSGVDWSCKSK